MRNSLSSSLLLTWLSVGCVATEAEEQPPSSRVSAPSKLTLQAEKSTYLPYQRVVLLASFLGEGAPELAPEAGAVTVHIAGPGKENHVFRPVAQRCHGLEKLPAQDAEVIDLSSDADGWLFVQPGKYQVDLRVEGSGLRSNGLELTVTAPTSSQDIEASAALAKSATFADFQRFDGGDRLRDDLALATRLAEGRSSYREDMRDLLVRHYSRQSVTGSGEIRRPDPDRALAYYDGVDAVPERGFSRVSTLWYMNRLQALGTARTVDVKAELDRLEIRFPHLQQSRLQTRPLR